MDAGELMHAMADVAVAAGFEVRRLGGASVTEGGPSAESGIVQLRGRVIVMLSHADPPERLIEVLAAALCEHAGAYLEAHFIAPAVRERLSSGR